MTPHDRRLLLGMLAVCAALAVAAWFSPALRPTGMLRDFSAFYCAGAAIDDGRDPYLAEPIGACERTPKPAGLNTGIAGLSVPAPLPPGALAAFALLARLPYAVAAVVWTGVVLGAVALTVVSLARLGVSAPVAFAALALTDGYASLALGQIAPVAIAALVYAAARLATAPQAAGATAAVALAEPHLGVPALVAIALGRRESRIPIAVGLLVFLAAGLAVAGPAVNLEYLRAVLPAHARSELASTRQFSITTILVEAGVPREPALALGDVSYALIAVWGIVAGLRLARTYGPASLALTPMAFAVVGGPFVHIVQMAAATPLALVLAARERAYRSALEGATIALASPWVQFATLGGVLVPLSALATAALVVRARRSPGFAALAALGAIALISGVEALVDETPPDSVAMLVAHADPHALAEASWTRYVAAVGSSDRAAYDLARLPTWLGALAVATVASSLALGGKGSRHVPRTRDRYS